jgi:hypothetical protein
MEGVAPHDENVTVDELLEGSFDKEDDKSYNDQERYKKTEWWKIMIAKAEEESGRKRVEAKAASNEPVPSLELNIRTKSLDLVIYIMIKIMWLLERRTKELEKRIEVAEATFAWLEASKAEKPNKVAEDVPEKTTGAITHNKQAGKEYQCRDGRTILMFCIIGAAWTMLTSTAILTESLKYPSTGASRMMNKKELIFKDR